MKSIDIVTTFAGILTVGALFSYFNASDANSKNLALSVGLTTGGITAGAFTSNKLSNNTLDDELLNLQKRHDDELSSKNQEIKAFQKSHETLTKSNNDLIAANSELHNRIESSEKSLAQIRFINSDLEKSTRDKLAELNAKLNTDDTRCDELIEAIKKQFAESLQYKIDTEYERIADTTQFRLKDERFEPIHPALSRFYNFLKDNHDRHYELLTNIFELEGTDIVEELTEIYFQISREISSYHVRLRNLLNQEERLTLDVLRDKLETYDNPKHFVPSEKARIALDSLRTSAKTETDKVKQFAIQNDEQLADIRANVSDLLNQLDEKNLEIANLQDEITRLKKPMYWNLANSRELEIGNLIISYFWNRLANQGIYLDRSHIETDGYNLTLYFQTDRNPRAILEKELNEHSEALQQFCRVIKPVEFSYCGAKGLMTAKVVLREKPKLETKDEDIYKYGLIPASQFCDIVARATDHKTKGKPTLRVMAATGEGKGIAVKNLLAYFADIEGWEIWLSDPVSGSEEDYWDTPKIAINSKDAGKAYKLFLQLFKERQELKQQGFTDRSVLAVFDEFDKQHDMEDKQKALEVMTAIRHSRQRQILIGQCAEVGKNGWAWDDMKNCSLLVLGASIGTLIKHLSKDFGWTKKKENLVKREYERFSTWADNQNINNPDIPDENQTRIALLIAGDRYQFLEVPIAHKGILKNGKAVFRDTLTTSVVGTVQDKPVVEVKSSLPTCPDCGTVSNSPFGKSGRYKCLNTDCSRKTFTPKN